MKFPEPEPRVDLLGHLALYDVSRHGRTKLYDGPLHKGENAADQTISSEYAVWSDHDLLLVVHDSISKLRGAISVRARVLNAAKTEIPVENYTTINDKELKEERSLVFADDTDLFRRKDDDGLVENLLALQRKVAQYRSLLQGAPLAGLRDIYSAAAIDEWLARIEKDGKFTPLTGTSTITPAAFEGAAKSLAVLDGAEVIAAKKDILDSLAALQQQVEGQLAFSRLTAQLDEGDLVAVRAAAQVASQRLGRWRGRLAAAGNPSASSLTGCSQKKVVEAKQEIKTKNLDGKDIAFKPGDRLWLSDVDGKVSIARTEDPAKTTAITFDESKLKLVDPVEDCLATKVPAFSRAIGIQLELLIEMSKLDDESRVEAAVASPCTSPSADTAPTVDGQATAPASPPATTAGKTGRTTSDWKPSEFHSPLNEVTAIRARIGCGVTTRMKRDLRDARIRLAPLELQHGDRIEITVRLTRAGISLDPAVDKPPVLEAEERFVVRVVQSGFRFRAGAQFGLIKRFSDVRTASSTDEPSNFKTAAGVNFSARIYSRIPWTDWLLPSFGIAAHAVDFDPNKTLELGFGPSIGLLNDHVHAGFGYNVSVDKHNCYWWLALDFLKAADTFSSFVGGGS